MESNNSVDNALAMIGIFSHFFYKQYKILKEDEEKESKRK